MDNLCEQNQMGCSERRMGMMTWYLVVFCLGAIAGVLFVMIVVEQRRKWLESERLRHGLCIKCQYNLTGNVSGVCPECGTAVEQPEPNP